MQCPKYTYDPDATSGRPNPASRTSRPVRKPAALGALGALVMLTVACTDAGTEPTEFDAGAAAGREAPGTETVIAATGSMGTGTMDLSAEVLLRPADGSGIGELVEGGVFTVEEQVCRTVPRTPAHPDGEQCRWRVYTVPENTFGDLAGRTLRNVPNDGTLFVFDVPVTMLRITYRARGTRGVANVRNCPWIPVEFVYFCASDGTVDFLTAREAERARGVMRQIAPRRE